VSERVYTIEVYGTPPSLNQLGARGSSRQWHRKKKQLQNEVELLLLAEGVPKRLARAEVTGTLYFPTVRGRDEGNYRSILEKAVGDALVNGGWLADDTPNRYSFGKLQLLSRPRQQPRTLLSFTTTKE
jgi:hypothetical protein